MKEQLTIEHLAPYLPYSLKVIMEGKKTNVAWMSTKNIAVIRPDGVGEYKKIPWKRAHLNIKPILRPLSDLSKKKFKDIVFPVEDFTEEDREENRSLCVSMIQIQSKTNQSVTYYDTVQKLIKLHFDINGLIEKGLALDINKVNIN